METPATLIVNFIQTATPAAPSFRELLFLVPTSLDAKSNTPSKSQVSTIRRFGIFVICVAVYY